VLAVGLGASVATTRALAGVRQRAKWLMTINAAIVAVALATTQLAARRAISATHLEYRGVHVVGVDSFSVGAGDADADIRLQSVSAAQSPWSIRVVRRGANWVVQPLAGIEQLRVSEHASASGGREFSVAQSAILGRPGDWAAVVDPSGAVVDTLRLGAARIESVLGNAFMLRAADEAIATRYQRRLRDGVALSGLDGRRAVPSAYERFVRAQELPFGAVVNGVRPTMARRAAALSWLPSPIRPSRPMLLSASPPYTLRGPNTNSRPLSFADSALVEVRNGESVWRFHLRTWRREPAADVGLALFFVKNPRPLDTPLPAGVSCRADVACGVISLRRLPPPVAHVALDYAGFDSRKFGLLGRVEQDASGVTVVLPRKAYRVERGTHRPVAIPVTPLSELADEPERESAGPPAYWVLLGASGTLGDDAGTIALIGIGLALLLAAIYATVAASSRAPAAAGIGHERSLMLGVTALLALLLTRVIVGARVAFFAPFLVRGIETAVGMWVAIAVVAVGLLSWSAWVPPLLVRARALLAGQLALRRVAGDALRAPARAWTALSGPRARGAAALTAGALLALTLATRTAVANGIVTGGVILLAWLCVAWVAAFAGPYFETFERGAWSVVEQLAPANRIAASTSDADAAGWRGRIGRACRRIPELPMMGACLAAELALIAPRLCALLGVATLASLPAVIHRRRSAGAMPPLPDMLGAAAGVAVFTTCVAVLRLASENGSMGAFVLVVFVALASVRIGRSVGSRLDAAASAGDAPARPLSGDGLIASLLLIAPLALLAPLVVIDMGLFLVMVVPVGFATLLAAGWRAAGRRLVIPALAFALLFALVGRQVLFPSMSGIRDAESNVARAEAFDGMSRVLGTRPPVVTTPMDRVAARSVATADRKLAEEMLISARPGPARDLLIPSIEQIWGAATYASAGWWGGGLGQAVVGGRGVAEAVSYAENTFSVFVLAEHGAVGALLVLALYLLLTGAVATTALAGAAEATASYRASRALVLVAALIVAIPASYVAMSNVGIVPITGQNMPFLGLNAWSDVAVCAGVVGTMITGALRRVEETTR
jgi:hypothetical protein